MTRFSSSSVVSYFRNSRLKFEPWMLVWQVRQFVFSEVKPLCQAGAAA